MPRIHECAPGGLTSSPENRLKGAQSELPMSEETPRKSEWPLIAVCICLAGFGLSAVPFVGTKYGDWPEACALAIGLLPLIYLAVRTIIMFSTRMARLEERVRDLEGRRSL
jgi:hypothetical protein